MPGVLDQAETYAKLDRSGMRERICGLPAQCREAWERAQRFELPARQLQVNRAVVFGMGGSAIGADMVGNLQAIEGKPPLIVQRDYSDRGLVDEKTLIIASSASGNTEETLTAFKLGLEKGGKGVAITRGGKLKALCETKGIPVFEIPPDGPPRTAVGYSVFPVLAILQKVGLAPDRSTAVREAIDELERLNEELRPDSPTARNRAKQVAQEIGERVTVIYGAQLLQAVARRWKTQLAENAKAWAFWEALPELHHNSVEAMRLEGPPAPTYVVALSSRSYNPRIALRLTLTVELLRNAGVPVTTVETRGAGPLAQIMTGTLFGDYVSLYLAMLRGIDPTPTPALDWVKAKMGG